jgi:hypothetical protein
VNLPFSKHTAKLFPLVLLAASASLLCAESISGTVTNKTVNKPAAGDDVVLIRLAQGMQESTRTKTDAKGHFTLELPDSGVHLVRVTHDKANYFRPAPPGTTTVDLDVFNAAAKVDGIAGEADVLRLQTDESGKSLRVVENFFVKNDSDPPRTQFSDRPFEFYLPPGAVVEGSAALAPNGMPVQSSPVPLGDPNHYAFVFPIRPGETRFQVTYHVPYSGSVQLAPRPVIQTDTVAIMMPKSMTFKAGAGAPYAPVNDEVSAQTYVARGVSPTQAMQFTVSGTGQLPRETPQGTDAAAAGAGGAPAQQAPGATSAAGDTRPGGGLGNPIDPEGKNDPWSKYKWWILGLLGLGLAAGAGVMLKGGSTPAPAASGSPEPRPYSNAYGVTEKPFIAALKEELFALESDRLEGRITESEYAEQKAAMDVVLRRALGRREPGLVGAGATRSAS